MEMNKRLTIHINDKVYVDCSDREIESQEYLGKLAAYEDLFTLKEVQELKRAKDEGRILVMIPNDLSKRIDYIETYLNLLKRAESSLNQNGGDGK